MFDPRTGRWLTEDPLLFEAGDSNLYRYVGNHPTLGTDPSGQAEECQRIDGTGMKLTFPDGTFPFGTGDGTVTVWKDASAKNPKGNRVDGGIWLDFATTKPDVTDDTHWIQFVQRYEVWEIGSEASSISAFVGSIAGATQKEPY